MSTDVSLFKGGLPAHLRNAEPDAVTRNLAGSGGGGGAKRISIRGSVFRLVVGGKEIAKNEERSMNVVIVNAAADVARTYYSGTFVEGQNATPDCWSPDGRAPDKTVEAPQHSNCVDCPQNVKGSGQGTSRACRHHKMIAVVLENDIKGDVFQLKIPSTSYWGDSTSGKLGLKAYGESMQGFGVPVSAVVTAMKFDTDSATPKLSFKAVRALDEDDYNVCVAHGQSAEAKAAVVTSFAPASLGKAPPAAIAPAAAAVVDVEEAPPKKRESKKDEAPAPKKDLKDVMAAWDDE